MCNHTAFNGETTYRIPRDILSPEEQQDSPGVAGTCVIIVTSTSNNPQGGYTQYLSDGYLCADAGKEDSKEGKGNMTCQKGSLRKECHSRVFAKGRAAHKVEDFLPFTGKSGRSVRHQSLALCK